VGDGVVGKDAGIDTCTDAGRDAQFCGTAPIGPVIAICFRCSSTCSSIPSGFARFLACVRRPQVYMQSGQPSMISTYGSTFAPQSITPIVMTRGNKAKTHPNTIMKRVQQWRVPSWPAQARVSQLRFSFAGKKKLDSSFVLEERACAHSFPRRELHSLRRQ
jgi:hypothetical protein